MDSSATVCMCTYNTHYFSAFNSWPVNEGGGSGAASSGLQKNWQFAVLLAAHNPNQAENVHICSRHPRRKGEIKNSYTREWLDTGILSLEWLDTGILSLDGWIQEFFLWNGWIHEFFLWDGWIQELFL